MINNRQQAGRRRGRGGNNGGGGGQRQGNPGRPDNGNRIDSRARGNASQLYEKYKNMASDAQRQGDRVNTEYYLQFADHYFRVLSEQRGPAVEQQPRRNRDDFDYENENEFGGGDFGDESEPVRAGEHNGDGQRDRDDRGNDARGNDDRGIDSRSNESRGNEARGGDFRQQRDDRPRGEPRTDRDAGARAEREPMRGDQGARAERDANGREGFRRDGNGDGRGERPRGEWQERPQRAERRPDPAPVLPVEVAGQRRAEPMLPGESLENRAEEVLEADRPLDAPPARRRGRPRREAEPVSPISSDEIASNGFEADRLPPALTVAANDEAPAEPKPRRRRVRPVEDTPTAAE